ncbi:hypothetical protein G6F35_011340 [Rhizopus arrhizus]|nr:hypothetical protein G6F35_011340 [Rhizopus arrhizus]
MVVQIIGLGLAAGPHRFRRARPVPVQIAGQRRQRRQRAVLPQRDLVARPRPADRRRVLATKQLERARQAGTECLAPHRSIVAGEAVAIGHGAGDRIGIAAAIEVLHLHVGMRTAVGHPRLPVVTEAVVEIEEAVAGIGAHPCPRGRGRYRAIESRARAIGVEQREATAKATVVIALVGDAGDQPGVLAQIHTDHAVERLRGAVQAGGVAVGLCFGCHQATAYAAFPAQRAGYIRPRAPCVPATEAAASTGSELAQRSLAHVVHRCRRIAGTGHQAVGTAHDLDAVIHHHVQVVLDEIRRREHRHHHAIELVVVDLETPRRERVAVGIAARDRDAWRGGQRIGRTQQRAVLDLLVGDDADRLRCLPRGQRQAGRRAHGIGGVGARRFGAAVEIGGDLHGGQL